MPLVLIVIITLIQDNTFKTLKESSINMIVLNEDNDSLGNAVISGLKASGMFKLHEMSGADKSSMKNDVAQGKYQIGVFIPKNVSSKMRSEIVKKIKSSLSNNSSLKNETPEIKIIIYLDPATKSSFKQTLTSTIQNFATKIENKLMFKIFLEEVGKLFPVQLPKYLDKEKNDLISIETQYPSLTESEILPNSVQHNVPAWTMFAIFFIVIPLSGNMIKERNEGSGIRLKTMPISYITVLSAKILNYLAVCILQFSVIFFAAVYLLPLLGLPELQMNVNWTALICIIISSGLAASGYAMFIGTIAETQEQAAISGSISVMIFAAIGGIWVPTYIMPDIMRKISVISPLNWGLEGFYDVFLRGGGISSVMDNSLLLIAFFIIMLILSSAFNKIKRQY